MRLFSSFYSLIIISFDLNLSSSYETCAEDFEHSSNLIAREFLSSLISSSYTIHFSSVFFVSNTLLTYCFLISSMLSGN